VNSMRTNGAGDEVSSPSRPFSDEFLAISVNTDDTS
jgi:hypothetical protein